MKTSIFWIIFFLIQCGSTFSQDSFDDLDRIMDKYSKTESYSLEMVYQFRMNPPSIEKRDFEIKLFKYGKDFFLTTPSLEVLKVGKKTISVLSEEKIIQITQYEKETNMLLPFDQFREEAKSQGLKTNKTKLDNKTSKISFTAPGKSTASIEILYDSKTFELKQISYLGSEKIFFEPENKTEGNLTIFYKPINENLSRLPKEIKDYYRMNDGQIVVNEAYKDFELFY
jgi:hypothetical protein